MMGREDRVDATARLRNTCVLTNDNDAVTTIAEAARTTQVVMINEAHDSPRDRALIADVAEALSKIGYNTYAAETLRGEQPFDMPPHPAKETGFYAQEPTFGALLRKIGMLGFAAVPYESRGPRSEGRHFTDAMNARENEQASNLINRTVRDQRDLKVLVHVGYSHNRERVESRDRREIRWLALRFKEITGIDPLTVDQTTFVSDRTGICASNSDGSALPIDRDIFVAHAPLAFERGRPTWRLARGQRFAEIPQALKRPNERVIYEARYADEPDDAVPADRILVDPGEDIPLLLAPGRYRVRAWTQDGAWTRSVPLTVAAPTPPAPQKARPKSQRRKKT